MISVSEPAYQNFLDDFNHALRFEYSVRALSLSNKERYNEIVDIVDQFYQPQNVKLTTELVKWSEIIEHTSFKEFVNSRFIFDKLLMGTLKESELIPFRNLDDKVKNKIFSVRKRVQDIRSTKLGSHFLELLELFLQDYPASSFLTKNNIADMYESVANWVTKSSYDEDSIKSDFYAPRALPKNCLIQRTNFSAVESGQLFLIVTNPDSLDEKCFKAAIGEFSRQYYKAKKRYARNEEVLLKENVYITKKNQIKARLEGLYCWDMLEQNVGGDTSRVEIMRLAIKKLRILGDSPSKDDYQNKFKSLRKFIERVDNDIKKNHIYLRACKAI